MSETCRDNCVFFQLGLSHRRLLDQIDQRLTLRYLNLLDITELADLEAANSPVGEELEEFERLKMTVSLSGPNIASTKEGIASGKDGLQEMLDDMIRQCPGGHTEGTDEVIHHCPGISFRAAGILLRSHAGLEKGLQEDSN